MAHSLSAECTPLKLSYDSCFNAWFEGYLQPVAGAATGPVSKSTRKEHVRKKREEYEEKCGKIWESYRNCVQSAVRDNGLTDMLEEARQENPLVSPPKSSADQKKGAR